MKAVLAYFGCAALFSLVAAEKKNVVIDLSHHDGNVDLEAARGDGIEIVIHKCTQGLSFVDPKYSTNKATANKLGLTWAAYHFADNTNGYEQAEHFVKHAGTVRWYIVDLEENPIGVLPNTVGRAQAETLVRRIEGLTGSYPIVYGSKYFLDALNSQVLAKCPLWVASYNSSPKMPKNWSSWLMWQYTDGSVGPTPHTVKGIGKVDRSYLNSDSL
uniref:Lysozyme M1 n=1 Tax=Lygus hesperus TaxID=30085 RepID=A0A0A9XM42_LYGHE